MSAAFDPAPLGCRSGRFKSDSRGATAVEFALALPVQLLLMFGIVQGGLALFVQNQLLNVTTLIGRELAIGAISAPEARAIALTRMPGWVKTLEVAVLPYDGSSGTAKFATIEIAVPLQEATIMDPLALFGDIKLRASTTVRMN